MVVDHEETIETNTEIKTRRHRSSTLSSLQDRTSDLANTELKDSGLRPTDYYELNLSALRFKIREWLLPIVVAESDYLSHIQISARTGFWDVYFSWTANFGSHTFYVLMLPIPLWFGYFQLARDLVFILGFGIYFSGVVKDYLCLPRPKSPPLHRITMSHYTAQEYGCPSSHSANATGVTLVILFYVLQSETASLTMKLSAVAALFLYFTSLIFGRIYCGMHGFTDIVMGSVIGASLFLLRYLGHGVWDRLILDQHNLATPFLLVAFYYATVVFHPVPLEECPCFEDSVAFMGVLLGLELSHYAMNFTRDQNLPVSMRCVIPYSYEQLGFIKSALRLAVGMLTVVAWKSVAKPALTSILTPVYNAVMSDKKKNQKYEVSKSNACWALKPRDSLELIVRMLVYAGIASIAANIGSVYNLIGLGCELRIEDYI